MRSPFLDDLSASRREAEARDRACIVTTHAFTFDYVLQDDPDDDPDEDDDDFDEDEDDEDGDGEDEDVETWQVSRPVLFR